MEYLKAVLKKDNDKKIEELKKLIVLGEKLNKDITPDKKKLEILLERGNKISSTPQKEIKESKDTKESTVKYAIESVYTQGNKVIIDFNVDVTKDDIKFFELKQNPLTKDVYDINGYFKDAAPTKLSIDGVEKIVIGQFKPDVLRIVFSDKKNLKTSYEINDRQIIISVEDVQKHYLEQEELGNPYVDKKNEIRTITAKNNKIFVRFNKNVTLNDIKYKSYKFGKNFENTFDIKGKFEHTKPTVLKIDEIDRVIVTDYAKTAVRIKIRNKNKTDVKYSLNGKLLTISVKEQKETLPYPNFRPRTIVIDAGHGGHDVGAVGPGKRYEKVVTLNVAKYLHAMLKQRGHKVYLTRYNDKYIKVRNRTILANEKNADIFISIHANAVPKAKATKVEGIETFFLSPARSERAKRVAAMENKEDITKMSSSTKSAFLESLNRPRITASHKLAIDVQAGLLQFAHSKYKDIKDSGVREGPFWVLVGAQMPSILIELGYMSHPVESKRLYSSTYQKLLANGIANGVDAYFSKNP
jgi:N-acetylmuramoyl-L-alanine amidase